MVCVRCGMEFTDGSKFCPYCGEKATPGAGDSGDIAETPISVVADDNDDIDERTRIVTDDRGKRVKHSHVNLISVDEPIPDLYGPAPDERIDVSRDGGANDPQPVSYGSEPDERSDMPQDRDANIPRPVVSGEQRGGIYCPQCGSKNEADSAFCFNCGAPLNSAGDPQMVGRGGAGKRRKQDGERGGKATKVIISLCAIAAVALCLIVFVLPRLGIRGGRADRVFYIKDNELIMTSGRSYEPVEMSDHIFSNSDGYNYSEIKRWQAVKYSEDGKYIYYPRQYGSNTGTNLSTALGDDGFDLYFMETGGKKKEGTRIDSGVSDYLLLDSGKVMYRKSANDGRKLYYFDGVDSVKLASDVSSWRVSKDKKKVLWLEPDGKESKIYTRDIIGKEEKNKIDTCLSLKGTSEDFSQIIYIKDDALYCCKNLKDKEKIVSEVGDVHVTDPEKPEVIYTKKDDNNELYMYDLIDDDYAVGDSSMREPDIEDYKSIETVKSFWGNTEEEVIDDAYYDALSEYEAKLTRDELRDNLKNDEVMSWARRIYCYDGKENTEIASFGKDVIGGFNYGWRREGNGFVFYSRMDLGSIDKIKLSSISDGLDSGGNESNSDGLKKLVEHEFDFEMHVIEGKKDVKVGDYESGIYGSHNLYKLNNKKYYMAMWNSGDTSLYEFHDGETKLITDDIEEISFLDDNIYYIRDVDDEDRTGSLYDLSGKIDSDVYRGCVILSDMGVTYMKDMDSDFHHGELYLFQNGKTEEIDDDVAVGSWGDVFDGAIAYIRDYNFNRNYGDLYLYKSGKSVRVDTDVTSLLLVDGSYIFGY